MRHQHAGLAIPDFPLAYGRLWPATDLDSIERYNRQRVEVTAANSITAFQIELQMIHRLAAVAILAGVAFCGWSVRRGSAGLEPAAPGQAGAAIRNRLALIWLGLIGVQAMLGAATVWSNKAADFATAHVLTGALSLATGLILCIMIARSLRFEREARVLPGDVRAREGASFAA